MTVVSLIKCLWGVLNYKSWRIFTHKNIRQGADISPQIIFDSVLAVLRKAWRRTNWSTGSCFRELRKLVQSRVEWTLYIEKQLIFTYLFSTHATCKTVSQYPCLFLSYFFSHTLCGYFTSHVMQSLSRILLISHIILSSSTKQQRIFVNRWVYHAGINSADIVRCDAHIQSLLNLCEINTAWHLSEV